MTQQQLSAVENNFTKGLITEFTGLNFPENAATDCDNCVFDLTGTITRRLGIDLEDNFILNSVNRVNKAVSDYKWNNVGGDGYTKVVVTQIGSILYLYRASSVTTDSSLSDKLIVSTITLSDFVASAGTFDATLQCEYADGNGYLFVYHPSCDPIYCTYVSDTITGNRIDVKIRDFVGVLDISGISDRPLTLSNAHLYNLVNQGWTQGSPWQGVSSTTVTVSSSGSKVFTVQAGLPVTLGDIVSITNAHDAFPGGILVPAGSLVMSGTVTAYSGTNLTILINSCSATFSGSLYSDWLISPTSAGYINTWNSGVGNYPSNADVWWSFKDTSGVFSPSTTVANVTLNTGPANKAHTKLSAFDMQRSLSTGVANITPVTTSARPRTGTWFQGRAWYTGVDSQQAATGTADHYTWTENIYFSQIVLTAADFGSCYQINDPTSDSLFDLLPTDGGVITIQGIGSIYKLFPIQNGLLVFGANGIKFITGSTGIGFTANDYTITDISSVRSISSTSFVNVNGLPYFWNEEGIYAVEPSKQGGLMVEPITVTTILSFYNDIPFQSKKYVRGDYDPIGYTVKWVYRDTNETSVTDRYNFNRILNYNTYNKAFYPFSLDTSDTQIIGIKYIVGSGGNTSPLPTFKFLTSIGDTSITFSEEKDETYQDWVSTDSPVFYDSYFITGYRLRGQAQKRFQMPYIYVYSDSTEASSYRIQGIWDYAISGNTGRWSTAQLINIFNPNFGITFRRHRIRGQGLVLQLKVSSVEGMPFSLIGWSSYDTQNAGV